jgi:integrase/recombinase XerD
MTGLGRQAKVLSDGQIRAMLAAVATRATAERDTAMILLSVRAGLRSKEISSLKWSMLGDAEGHLTDTLAMPNSASKGHRGGRELPLHPELAKALARLYAGGKPSGARLILNSRGQPLGANGTAQWFLRLYRSLGFDGCSSHSGRRTAITGWARKIATAGGSLRDVQSLAGHASLADTQRYIDQSPEAKRRVVAM